MMGHQDLYKAIYIVSLQVSANHDILVQLLKNSGSNIDPKLLELSNELKGHTEDLQAALEKAQASTTNQKET